VCWLPIALKLLVLELSNKQNNNLKMDKLTKDQKDEYATSFAALALYDVSIL
jgi:hypothetical protein